MLREKLGEKVIEWATGPTDMKPFIIDVTGRIGVPCGKSNGCDGKKVLMA